MARDARCFAWSNVVGLVAAGAGLLLLSRDGALDWWFARQFFDAASGGFPLKETPLLAQAGHTGLKWFAVVIWLTVVALAIVAWRVPAWRSWRAVLTFAVLSALASVSAVSLLKATSLHSCPWDIVMFGGKAEWFALLDTATANAGPGRCWPGGHASGGFALLAGYFSLRDRHSRAARVVLAAALLLGGVMSAVQLARGAHFLSHNLWTLWITWAVCLVSYLLFRRFLVPLSPPH